MFKIFYKTRFLLIFLAISLISCSQLLAQQQAQVNYQGVARKADGSPVSEQSIALRLTIKDGGANGNNVYSETRLLTTNKFGLFTTVIGSTGALSQTGTMAGVIWATGNKFLQVEIDPAGGNRFVDLGTSQLQSVPYAIYANEASPSGNAGGDLSGSYPNPVVSKLQGAAVSNVAPNNGQILKWNGTAWAPSDEPGVVGVISSNLPITSTMSGGNATIGINKADNVTDGYLTKADWVIFNGKASVVYVEEAIAANAATIQTALNTKVNIADTATMLLPYAKQIATQTALALKAPLVSPTFTGTVSGITKTMVGLGDVDNTTDEAKPISAATQTALNAKADLASPTLSGTPLAPTATAGTSTTQIATTAFVGSAVTTASTATSTALALKAPLASPTFTGTVSGINSTMVGLGNVDNTTDAAKPISSATQTALDAKASATDLALKAPLASPTFTGTVTGITSAMVGLGNVDNTTDIAKPISSATQTALDAKASATDLALKAPLASPTFTGTVTGITSAMVGLGEVNNTSDSDKPISTATQSALDEKATNTALDLKAPIASPTFTGTVTLPTGTIGITQTATDNTTALATTEFVTTAVTAATPDATDLIKGKILLAGDLAGTATEPTITNSAVLSKVLTGYQSEAGTIEATDNILEAIQKLDGNAKTFNEDIIVNGITLGKGPGGPDGYNTAVGFNSLSANTDGNNNTAVGLFTLMKNTTGGGNTAVGTFALPNSVTGEYNTALGNQSLEFNTSGSQNTAIGMGTIGTNTTGSSNTVLGASAGRYAYDDGAVTDNKVMNKSVIIGADAMPRYDNETNQIVIGYQAIGKGSNTIQLGNSEVAAVNTSGKLTTGTITYPNADGTAGQVLTTDGAGEATWATASPVSSFTTDISVNDITIGRGNGGITSNTALGSEALKLNTEGSENTAIGLRALLQNTTGVRNTAIGSEALTKNNGEDNTATGHQSLYNNSSGNYNAGFGTASLTKNTTGSENTALGAYSLTTNTTGNSNTTVGYESMRLNATGNNNTAIGKESLKELVTGNYNTALGAQALQSTNGAPDNRDIGSYNTAVGVGAIDANTTGSNNTVLGTFAGRNNDVSQDSKNTLINNSVLIGAEVRTKADNGENEIVIGYRAIGKGSNTVQLGNTAITSINTSGKLTTGQVTYPNTKGTAGQVLSTDADGIASWGDASVTSNFSTDITVHSLTLGLGGGSGPSNIALGVEALKNNLKPDLMNFMNSSHNTAVGNYALMKNTTGSNNTAVGTSLMENLTGQNNIALGNSALSQNSDGSGNTAVGVEALTNNISGLDNTAVGMQSLQQNKGSGNTAFGKLALYGNNTGVRNTAVGKDALSDEARQATASTDNTGLGYAAGTINRGIQNTFIGSGTDQLSASTSITNATAIGYGAKVSTANAIQLGNTAVTAVNTSGKLTTGQVTYPNTKGTAGQVLTTDADGIASWGAASSNPVFTTDISVNEISLGRGTGSDISNLVIGREAFTRNASGTNNITIGRQTAANSTEASNNTIVGNAAVYYNEESGHITALGFGALHAETGEGNTAIGSETGRRGGIKNDLTNSTFLGKSATAGAGAIDNATAIGNGAIVNASNKIQLGNTAVTAVNTSGKLTTGEVTYPNTKGTTGQVLITDADGIASWGDASVVTDFSSDITVKGISIGQGPGTVTSDNIVLGSSALAKNTSGQSVLGIGTGALRENTTGSKNLAIGHDALKANIAGNDNLAVGFSALSRATGTGNTAVGVESLGGTGISYSTSIGYGAGNQNLGSNNTFLGANTGQLTPGFSETNSTAIGYGAQITGANQIQLGNNQVTEVKTSGDLSARSFIKSDGAPNEYLMADGSVSTKLKETFQFAPTNNSITADRSGSVFVITNDFFGAGIDEDLPVGFNCEIINASGFEQNYILGTKNGNALFYSAKSRVTNNFFEIIAGGTVRLNVIEINNQKRYYITGDVAPSVVLPTSEPVNSAPGMMYLNNSTLMIFTIDNQWVPVGAN